MEKEGGYVNRPPLLDGDNYDYWKSRMTAFLKSIDSRTWKAVLKGWSHPVITNKEGVSTLELKAEEDCDSFKSPGPDDINFGFIKDFWYEMQGDVMRFISEFHRNGKLTKGLNVTFIALIPKVDSPQRLNDFRPISLLSSLYKILAKVLENRLRLVMGSVISGSQTAFVKDRQILDGILIANEVVDEARRSKKELMLFKVDFEKVYDSVDWGYLDDAMVDRNLFTGYSVGESNMVAVTHF
ncbi:cysteine-rich receptor-like protein kinase [Trifolium medium]|uniref:Cysteine-rich receptor-like protein kinase n=1 Tax=Trifolium medium TaxID=97028 RepID=A0A392MWS7_9FABA|nr:cysteine-rich receptor-like protein kinase [Trifolium medium]